MKEKQEKTSGGRHKAREVALQALFEMELTGHSEEDTLRWGEEENLLSPQVGSFARELIRGVLANKENMDAIVQRFAPLFPVGQLSGVDRNILRLALWELLYQKEIPYKVAINEAVRLAQTFGAESSARFVNGVLASIYKELLARSSSPPQGSPEGNPLCHGSGASPRDSP